MRAEPPPPPRRRRNRAEQTGPPTGAGRRRRCPYLEEILKEPAGPFQLLTRYRADCHVDRATHRFLGRHPSPPCITDPTTCGLYQQARSAEDRTISRYTD